VRGRGTRRNSLFGARRRLGVAAIWTNIPSNVLHNRARQNAAYRRNKRPHAPKIRWQGLRTTGTQGRLFLWYVAFRWRNYTATAACTLGCRCRIRAWGSSSNGFRAPVEYFLWNIRCIVLAFPCVPILSLFLAHLYSARTSFLRSFNGKIAELAKSVIFKEPLLTRTLLGLMSWWRTLRE
jgi:hypothetical protein